MGKRSKLPKELPHSNDPFPELSRAQLSAAAAAAFTCEDDSFEHASTFGVSRSVLAAATAAAARGGTDMPDDLLDDDDVGDRNEVDPSLDDAAVVKKRDSLLEAIDAEHEAELREQAERLKSSKEELVRRGAMLTGLHLQVMSSGGMVTFRATRPGPDGHQLPLGEHRFRLKQDVALFLDIDAEVALHEAAAAAEGGTDAADGQPAAGEAVAAPPVEDGGSSAESASDEEREGDEDNGRRPRRTQRKGRSKVEDMVPDSAPELLSVRALLAARLVELGLQRCFDGTVREIKPEYITFGSRNDGALAAVQGTPDAIWVLFDSGNDVTFRRQRAAATALGRLFSTSSGKAATSSQPRGAGDGERNVRQILIEQVDCGAADAARRTVDWMTPAARTEMLQALQGDAGLNDKQRHCLVQSTSRSVTLLQGPPGTGKSRTLAAMVKALCRVFHNPGFDVAAATYGFALPSGLPLSEWTAVHVAAWLGSLVTTEEGRESQRRGAQGVSLQVKEWLLLSFQAHSGARLHSMTTKMAEREISGSVEDELASSQAASGTAAADKGTLRAQQAAAKAGGAAAAALCAPVFAEVVQQLKQSLASSKASAYEATSERDMRILVSADTNVAVDNLLRFLHGDADFRACGYSILRLGKSDKMDETLAPIYSSDLQLQQHPLFCIFELLKAALEDRTLLTKTFAAKLEQRLLKFSQDALRDSKTAHFKVLVRSKMEDMAQMVAGALSQRVLTCVDNVLKVGSKKKHQLAERDLEKLRDEIRKIAMYDLVLRAQVVLGTNTSIGELRQWNVQLQLSNPIVVMDEAGQATEPSAFIPLTLGAEWVIMAADMQQLRPTLKTNTAMRVLGYHTDGGGSLYGRLCQRGLPEFALRLQYRMHPCIRDFPSSTYYHKELGEDVDFPVANLRVPVPRHERGTPMTWWPFQRSGSSDFPVVFLDVEGGEEKGGGVPGMDHSYCNRAEASVVLRLMLLMGTDPSVHSIAVISPYKAQNEILRDKMWRSKGHLDHLRASQQFHPVEVSINTVDGFQGQEADVVIVSLVRAGTGGLAIGHLADHRRLNVAITRAKRALLVVGNHATLSAVTPKSRGTGDHRNDWSRWINWVADKGSLVPSTEVELQYLGSKVVLPPEMWLTWEDERRAVQARRLSTPKLQQVITILTAAKQEAEAHPSRVR